MAPLLKKTSRDLNAAAREALLVRIGTVVGWRIADRDARGGEE